MGIEEKGERQRNERSVSEENITFYQLYLHKLKCRQFTTEQWVSEKSNLRGEARRVSMYLSLGEPWHPASSQGEKTPFHSPATHNIYSQDALYSCQSQIIREQISRLIVQCQPTVELM